MLRSAVLLCLALAALKNAGAQTGFTIKAGVTQSFIKETFYKQVVPTAFKSGLQIGVAMQTPLLKQLLFRPGLQLTQKGFTDKKSRPETFYFNRRYASTYLEVPLDILYSRAVTKTTHLFAGSGLVPGFHFYGAGKTVVRTTDEANELQTFVENGRGFGDYHFDCGVNVLAGLQVKRLALSATYTHGLSNVTPGSSTENSSRKNRTLAVAVAYFLKGHRS